jgi:putative ABC transport system substrate-binding protein
MRTVSECCTLIPTRYTCAQAPSWGRSFLVSAGGYSHKPPHHRAHLHPRHGPYAPRIRRAAARQGSLIGVLTTGSPPSEAQRRPGPFRQALRELGWIEGKHIAFESRYAVEQLDRLPDLAAELVRLRPDVIVTTETPALRAAQQATTTVPIMTTGAAMLVEQGIVASLAQPGGNITGLSESSPDLVGKRLELLKNVVPGLA